MVPSLFTGKIRVQLLTKLLLNPASKVYLRGLEKDFGVSSNTVRLELNKLSEMRLIEAEEDSENGKVKNYSVNKSHPMFSSIREIILKFVGIDQIVDQILNKVGQLSHVYLTGDLAQGNNSPFVDLVMVGDVDKSYLYQLIEKVEPLIDKKIRVALYGKAEFNDSIMEKVELKMKLI